MHDCPICGNRILLPINSFCIFTNVHIYRFQCQNCDLIFGPVDMINLPQQQLIEKYKNLYMNYKESDSTDREVKTFLSMMPDKNKLYLNYGSGIWSKSSQIIKDMGYNIDCYDFSFNNSDLIKDKKYDGIMSHNVIEHFQSPLKMFNYFSSILKSSGCMIHASPCYKYCYEYSIFHLYFFVGKSLEILSNKSNFCLEHIFEESDFIIKKFTKMESNYDSNI